MKRLETDRAMLRRGIERQDAAQTENVKKNDAGIKADDISVGMRVEIVSSGFKGTVTNLPDSKGNLSVQCGIINYKTNVKDLIPAEDEEPEKKKSGSSGMRGLSRAMTISPELNIIGHTVDDAIAKLDEYLDDAYMSHLGEVRIVHGKGTGKLRDAVQRELKKIKYVKSFRQGEYGEGDAGVTVVKLKQ